jgi:hypothetical protein
MREGQSCDRDHREERERGPKFSARGFCHACVALWWRASLPWANDGRVLGFWAGEVKRGAQRRPVAKSYKSIREGQPKGDRPNESSDPPRHFGRDQSRPNPKPQKTDKPAAHHVKPNPYGAGSV